VSESAQGTVSRASQPGGDLLGTEVEDVAAFAAEGFLPPGHGRWPSARSKGDIELSDQGVIACGACSQSSAPRLEVSTPESGQ